MKYIPKIIGTIILLPIALLGAIVMFPMAVFTGIIFSVLWVPMALLDDDPWGSLMYAYKALIFEFPFFIFQIIIEAWS